MRKLTPFKRKLKRKKQRSREEYKEEERCEKCGATLSRKFQHYYNCY